MFRRQGGRRLVMALLLTLAYSQLARAQKYKPEDPLPPGAQAKVLSFAGKVTEIKGLVSGVAGKAEALNAALKDLGARTTGMEIRIELASDVLFDFDKADLRPAAVPSLEKVVTVLGAYPSASATIEGHTDNKGNDAYNQKLSERRAESVRECCARTARPIRWPRAGGARRNLSPPTASPAGWMTRKAGKRTVAWRLSSRKAEILRRRPKLLHVQAVVSSPWKR